MTNPPPLFFMALLQNEFEFRNLAGSEVLHPAARSPLPAFRPAVRPPLRDKERLGKGEPLPSDPGSHWFVSGLHDPLHGDSEGSGPVRFEVLLQTDAGPLSVSMKVPSEPTQLINHYIYTL